MRRRRIALSIAAVCAVSLALIVTNAGAAAIPALNLVCPVVDGPVAGQTVTCTYVDATTPAPTTTQDTTTTTSPTTTTATTTTTPMTTDPPATTTTTPATSAFPNTSNTGVPAATSLTTSSGDLTVSTPNAVVDGRNVTGSILVRANGVVIKNSRVGGSINNAGGSWSFTVQDSEVGGTGCTGTTNGGVAVGYENYTVLRSYIHGFADGPRISGANVTVQDSLIVTCRVSGAHGDGVQGYYGGSNAKIYHNTIDVRASAPDVTSAIFIADNSTSADVRDNLLMGGGYTLRLHNDTKNAGSNWRASGNRIVSGSWVNGDTYNTNVCGKTGFVWEDNTLVTLGSNFTVASTVAPMSC